MPEVLRIKLSEAEKQLAILIKESGEEARKRRKKVMEQHNAKLDEIVFRAFRMKKKADK